MLESHSRLLQAERIEALHPLRSLAIGAAGVALVRARGKPAFISWLPADAG